MAKGCTGNARAETQLDAHLGIYLNSAPCTSELKRIAAEDYEAFVDKFRA